MSSGRGLDSPSLSIMLAAPSRIDVSDTAAASSLGGGEAGDWTPTNRRDEAGSRAEELASLSDVGSRGEAAGSRGGVVEVAEGP